MRDKRKHKNKHKGGMFTHVKQAQENRKFAGAKWTDYDNRVVCACFKDVHTGETSKVRMHTSIIKRKMFLFLFLRLCLCLFLLHKYEPGFKGLTNFPHDYVIASLITKIE